ncbi:MULTISPECIES: MCE family protein [unclassified Nocardioides]|uniref:MCE family protein n=1 Tax=unclassified Nocardioides TaxID=2615069 RepID=UPI0009F0E5B6|nr:MULTISPECIES: MCE family protein [unclassified Nocardioides]GAW48260.1 virulence factor Mce family protein [Nocardioides sp. PD653-B2]GAW52908.1 virulence factor Mce family protein [Nocardioides sp. PD653]
MLVNVHHDSPAEHRRLLVAGVVFLTVIALMVGLSIAIYQKTFVDVTTVTIKADRAGLQLAKFGDVRIHGALVGQVRSVDEEGHQASIEVALQPDEAERIPDNVSVQILPTTLFGQKFISFVTPDDPSSTPLADGDVIPADRVETNVELSRILANLFPLLRSVQPADLNMTLNALATALGGRGEQLGDTMDQLDTYLGEIDDHLPTLREDLIKLADVADTYDLAAPDLLGVLRNITVTGQTVIDNKQEIGTFFSDLQGLADTSTRVLSDNETNIIRVGQVTEPMLRLLAVYSPEFPCLIKGAARYAPRLARTFEGNQIKQYIEFGTAQYRAYDERDRPVYGEVGHGPWCLGLPYPPVPSPPIALEDGSDADDHPPTSPLPGGANRVGADYSGSEGEQQIVNALLAQRSGRAADSYGSLGSLMYGPLVRESGDGSGGGRG